MLTLIYILRRLFTRPRPATPAPAEAALDAMVRAWREATAGLPEVGRKEGTDA